MQVSINLVGILQEYYAGAVDTAGGPLAREAAAGTTVRAMISALGVPHEDEYFIMLNGDRLDDATASARVLEENDAIVLVPVIKGG
ncbi:MAG: MoaD/ThiS family protein [Proteobacteria bacterium]|nr:MoaD/ThiS family protein [Pseudomonadota bacterium]